MYPISIMASSYSVLILLHIGSSVLLGAPLHKDLTLNMKIFETATLLMTVLTVSFVVMDGESNYLKGMVLCFAYAIIAACFFVHKVWCWNLDWIWMLVTNI